MTEPAETCARPGALTEEERAALWRSLGATTQETQELLRYAQSEFEVSQAPTRFPLSDEPFVATWSEYCQEAELVGAWACLRNRLVQLRFPIEAGISESPAYRAATRRGIGPAPELRGLELARPADLRLFLASTPVGRVPVILAPVREDFLSLVRALAHRNEPQPILDSVGATIIGGYNNWDRVAALRAQWEASDPSGSPLAWAARWREIVSDPSLYQDRFIILGTGPYSGVAAAELDLDRADWTKLSIAIRLEHECTHYFTRRALGSMRNRLFDELIADYLGIVAAVGGFRADWLVRFLGLERHPAYRPGSRLDEYRGGLEGGSFRVLCAAVVRCARNLESIDKLRPQWDEAPSAVADKAEVILALATVGLEGLAGRDAVERYQAARARRCPAA